MVSIVGFAILRASAIHTTKRLGSASSATSSSSNDAWHVKQYDSGMVYPLERAHFGLQLGTV